MSKISIPLSPAQFTFLKTDKPFAAFVGGWWSGKSYVGAMRIASRMKSEPGYDHCYWGPTMSLVKGKPLRCLQECLTKLGIRYRVSKPDGAVKFDCFGHGSVWLRSFNNIESIRSFDAVEQVVDEIDSLPRDRASEVWQQILGRSRGGERPFVGTMSTPDAGKAGFLYNFFAENEEDNDVELVHARTRDNVWANGVDDYVRRLETQLPTDLANLYLEGQFISRGEGRVFNEYDGDSTVSPEFHPNDAPRIGLDFNIDACCAVVGKMKDKKLYIIDEFVSKNTEAFCNEVRKRYGNGQIYVYPDASGQSRSTNANQTDLDILRKNRMAIRAGRTNPRIDDRVSATNVAFRNGHLFIDRSCCPKLSNALLEHQYEREKPKKYANQPNIDDWTDAFTYMVHKLFTLNSLRHLQSGVGVAWRG